MLFGENGGDKMITYKEIPQDIVQYVFENTSQRSLKKVRLEKIEALSNKLAYLYCQKNGSSYRKVQPQIADVIRRLRCRPEYK